MTCERAMELLDAYVDGELDAAGTREMEWHVGECSRCSRALTNRRAVVGAVREFGVRHHAPDDLRHGEWEVPERMTLPLVVNRWKWAAMGMAACLAVVCATWGVRESTRGGGPDTTLAMLVSNHVRSLQDTDGGKETGGHLVDVVSTDRHTVKPWFQGRLTFAPVVRDLKEQGFPLVGGRMDVVGTREVAALIYRRDKHVINLFMWPASDGDAVPRLEPSSGGYHVVRWTSGGMTYWAVSDVESRELDKFAYEFSHTE